MLRQIFCVAACLCFTPVVAAQKIPASSAERDTTPLEEDTSGLDRNNRSPSLADRIPSVTRRLYRKQGNIELYSGLGVSLNDPFYTHVIGSLGVAYHFNESLALGFVGDYYNAQSTALDVAPAVNSTKVNLRSPRYGGRLEVTWAPIYGKMSVFAEKALHFDTYITVGGGMMSITQNETSNLGSIALGQHYFMTPWLSLRIEVRDQILKIARDPATNSDKKWQNFLTAGVSLCFFLPVVGEGASAN